MANDRHRVEGLDLPLRKKVVLFLGLSFWVAVFVHAFGFLLFRTSRNSLSNRQPTEPFVSFVSADSFAQDTHLEESAMLFDSAPLFIRTRWNMSQLIEVDFEDVSLRQLSEFEPQIKLLEELRPNSSLVAEPYEIDEPVDLLASRFSHSFSDFGKSAGLIEPYDSVAPLAEVTVLGESRDLSISIPVDLGSAKSFSALRPVSYTVRMYNGIAWSVPLLTETSGDEVFDQSVAQWLNSPEILALLPNGYLSIRVFFW